MPNKILLSYILFFFSFTCVRSLSQNPSQKTSENKEWVVQSNSYTKILIDIDEKSSPEFGCPLKKCGKHLFIVKKLCTIN